MLLQVKYVEMVKQQDDAYKEAVEECRARTQTNNGTSTLPQRQISNYFVQFRKVPQFFFLVAYLLLIRNSLDMTVPTVLSGNCVSYILDCKPSFTGEAYIY